MIPGWDDAKPAKLIRGKTPKTVTFVYPYYCNPEFLFEQFRRWWKFDPRLRKHLRLIVVDDGSPEPRQADVVLRKMPPPFPVRGFFIEVDVRWNWIAARNIAMHHAPDGWCMATDMDHVCPEETAEALIFDHHDPRVIYRFQRTEGRDDRPIKPHPNSWFMTKEMFWKFGGYDEGLSGYYGTDGDARRRWAAIAPVRTLREHLARWEHYGDSSTIVYKRKQPVDNKVFEIIARREAKWRPKVLSFPYHELQISND